MSEIQKLIDRVRPLREDGSYRDYRLAELCDAAQGELDRLNSESLCYNCTAQEHSVEHVVRL